MEDNPQINVRHLDLKMFFPDFIGNENLAKLNWIQKVVENYYMAGITFIDEGSSIWLLQINPEGGFIPIRCLLYKLSEEENKNE